MDLFEQATKDNTPVYSVSDLSSALKRTVEGAFSNVRLRGEVGRVTRPASGHVYLDLKDDKSVINCNIWKPTVSKLDIFPEEGMEVIVTGKLSTYAPTSKYNFIIETLEIAGEGALMALLEKRKKALAGEGLFDADRKQLLPYMPKRIGVITSRTGAVIRDILHRLSDRFPCEVILWPVTVQGDKCADEVVAAIEGFNRLPQGSELRPDVIIVARGGGSIEDLWGFNEERVVRAVAGSNLPIISAVGHETDTTLIDFASDMRAPTPTAAAEMAVPVRADLLAWLSDIEARRLRALTRILSAKSSTLRELSRSLPRAQNLLDTPRQRLDLASSQLLSGLNAQIAVKRNYFTSKASGLHTQSIYRNMEKKRAHMGVLTQKIDHQFATRLAHHRFKLSAQSSKLLSVFERQITRAKMMATRGGERLSAQNIQKLIEFKRGDLVRKIATLTPAITRKLALSKSALLALDKHLNALSYERILDRGFAVIRDENGEILSSILQTKNAARIQIMQRDGNAHATINQKG